MANNVPNLTDEYILQVENLWVRKGGVRGYTRILRGISFDIRPGEFVAIIGPNGAGKTKLLEAILGDRPYAGDVLVRGHELYDHPEYWLRRIGWVPVYNVLHENLRVKQALIQVGRLRVPGVSPDKIEERVDELLDELEFPKDRRGALIRNLSSGERKRLDLCAELLTNPPLLFLDEPTTNLDPDAERALMRLLRDRSRNEGQAIVVVTHTLQSLHYCDRVLFLANGKLRAQGHYEQVLEQLEDELDEPLKSEPWQGETQTGTFGKDPGTMQQNLEADPASRWAIVYRKSRIYESEPLGDLPLPREAKPRKQSRKQVDHWIHEIRVLLKRNWLLLNNNMAALGIYLLLGPFSGVLSRIVLRDNAFIQDEDIFGYSSVFDTSDARQAIFIIALVVTLLGLIGSFLDVTRERFIYRYERVKGLSAWAYLLSKWTILVMLVGIPAPTFMMMVLTFQGQSLPSLNMAMLTLYLACIASITLGLAISAASSSERTATGLLGIVVVFFIFFSGGVDFNERFQAILERISMFATSHWAAEGLTTSVQLYCWASNPRFQDFYSLGHLVAIWLSLVLYILLAIILAYVALRMQDTWYPRRIRFINALFSRHVLVILPLALFAWSWAAYLTARSQDYYYLRAEKDNVRIENAYRPNTFQAVSGYMSQSLCPLPTALPPPATPMVAVPPTPVATDGPHESQTQNPARTEVSETLVTVTPVFDPVQPGSTDPDLSPLPQGKLVTSAPILFGPGHGEFPLETLPDGSNFLVLGKNLEGEWFRVKEENTGREIVGWIGVDHTDLPASQTGSVAAPPGCAVPRAYLESDDIVPEVGWTSDVDGHVVTVLDLFRDEAGMEISDVQLMLALNGEVVETYPVGGTRHSFFFRGLAIDVRINQGDQLELFLSNESGSGEMLHLRVSIFFVPSGCSF